MALHVGKRKSDLHSSEIVADVESVKKVKESDNTSVADVESVKNVKESDNISESSEHASAVAAHYNTLEEKGMQNRFFSPIFHMRNFNNWIKSVLIIEYINLLRNATQHGTSLRVLDMCCGKGGDLFKWRKASIQHLICADIASVSVEQCKSRYDDLVRKSAADRNQTPIFSAEFISADCTKDRLREKYKDASIMVDLVSCQFAFHYCFESLPQAECMLQNAAECLKPGGFFIGTIPDAYEVVSRVKKNGGKAFGNNLFHIEFNSDMQNKYPLFGAMYNFHLEGVVDCPEFLVHFPTLIELAKKFGLEFVSKYRFVDYFEKMKGDGANLFSKMQCFESYPPFPEKTLSSTKSDDYKHAEEHLNKLEHKGAYRSEKISTLSKSEWEAISIYAVFAFQKLKTTWDCNGKPVYHAI